MGQSRRLGRGARRTRRVNRPPIGSGDFNRPPIGAGGGAEVNRPPIGAGTAKGILDQSVQQGSSLSSLDALNVLKGSTPSNPGDVRKNITDKLNNKTLTRRDVEDLMPNLPEEPRLGSRSTRIEGVPGGVTATAGGFAHPVSARREKPASLESLRRARRR